MAKGAATEEALAGLHATLATVIDKQLSETIVVNLEAVEDDGAAEELMFSASPALLTVAARFLKDNDVTVDTGESAEGMSKVQKRLEDIKKNRGKVISLADLHPVAADG